ncbi:hypothetical protein V3C99_010100 [Haemonchus contortus]
MFLDKRAILAGFSKILTSAVATTSGDRSVKLLLSLKTMNTSQERFEEQFHQLLIEYDEESEGHQDETADESQPQDEDPDFESESESGDEPEMSWSTTRTQDR